MTESTGGYIPPHPWEEMHRERAGYRPSQQTALEPHAAAPVQGAVASSNDVMKVPQNFSTIVSQSIAAVAAGRKLLEGFARLEVVFYWM